MRRTRRPRSSRAAANGSYCDGVISVSTTVAPSGSTTTPALGRPRRGGCWSQAMTPASRSSSATERRLTVADRVHSATADRREHVAVRAPGLQFHTDSGQGHDEGGPWTRTRAKNGARCARAGIERARAGVEAGAERGAAGSGGRTHGGGPRTHGRPPRRALHALGGGAPLRPEQGDRPRAAERAHRAWRAGAPPGREAVLARAAARRHRRGGPAGLHGGRLRPARAGGARPDDGPVG